MDDEPTIGEEMEPYIQRLAWDFEHLFDGKSVNPWVRAGEGDAKPKNRTGFEDVTHAIKNVAVEWGRIVRRRYFKREG